MPFASLPDVKLHYEISGAEHLPVVVFSNGLGTTMRMWEPQVDAFSKHFRALRCDTRGHGQSGVTAGPYTIEQLSSDVVGLLDVLKVERAHFCGLSMGGLIGMFLGTNLGGRFHKIVLCDTAARIGTNDSWNTRIQAVQSGGMKAISGGVIERWLTASFRVSHPEETQSIQAMLEAANPEDIWRAAARCAMRTCGARSVQFAIPVWRLPARMTRLLPPRKHISWRGRFRMPSMPNFPPLTCRTSRRAMNLTAMFCGSCWRKGDCDG